MNRDAIAQHISDALASADDWAQTAFDRMRDTRDVLFAEVDRETESNPRPSIVSDAARKHRYATALHKAAHAVQVAVESLNVYTNSRQTMQTVIGGLALAEAVEAYYAALANWQTRYGDTA